MNSLPVGFQPGAVDYSPTIFGAGGGQAARFLRENGVSGENFGKTLEGTRQASGISEAEPVARSGTGSAVQDFIIEVDRKDKAASEMRASVLSGDSTNLHRTMIASQEASVSFTLMVEMRNKLMEAYQELMRMPV